MNDDSYFTPSPSTLATTLAEQRAQPFSSLSVFAKWLDALDAERRDILSVTDCLQQLAQQPLPYLPTLDPNPPDLELAALCGLRLLVFFSDELPSLDDDTALTVLRALYEHAEFLYCFNVTRSPSVRVLNGAFLTLTGFWLTAFPVSAHWRLVGMTRLISNLEPLGSALTHDGWQAALTLWGQTWLAQFPALRSEPLGAFASELIVWAAQRARDTNLPLIPAWAEYYQHIVGQPLAHEQWTDLGVTAEEIATHNNLYASQESRLSSEGRSTSSKGENPQGLLNYERWAQWRDEFLVGRNATTDLSEAPIDLREADEICENLFTLRIHMTHRHPFGDDVDWSLVLFDDLESNVSISWHYHAHVLALAYQQTHDEKYLTHWIRLMRSWLAASPVPERWQPLLAWRTLEVGSRAGQQWPPMLLVMAAAPRAQHTVLADMVRCYLEQGRYLLAHQAAAGSNWFQVESAGLGVVALLFPDWREAERMWQCALRRLQWVNQLCFLPDDFQAEGSPMYHWFPLRGIVTLYELARRTGRELPAGFIELVERWLAVYLNMAQPDGCAPLLNDCNPSHLFVTEPLTLATKLFPHRDDFRYLATQRREGQPPTHTSSAFPHAGYYISRSSWETDALYVVFDAGAHGLSHQHEDKLNFVLHGHGRTLIGDPSIYQYRQDIFELYWRSARGHNAVLVDGKGQNRLLRRDASWREARPDPETQWLMGERFDFGLGWYREGFATRSAYRATEADRATLDRTIHHARALFVVKGEYVVLVDWVMGEGEHTVEQVFHLAPIVAAPQPDSVRSGTVVLESNGIVRSAEPDWANIALIPAFAARARPSVRIETGLLDPASGARGWAALYGKQPVHDVTYTVRATLPLALPMVLWPQAAGQGVLPRAQRINIDANRGQPIALTVATPNHNDLFIIAAEPTEMRWNDGEFHGQAVWVRQAVAGKVRSVAAIHTRQLVIMGKTLLASDRATTYVERVL
jgi:hypothetical protein